MPPRIAAILALLAFSAFAQAPAAPKLEFEVASVKLVEQPPGPHAVALQINHGNARLVAATLRQIIVQAYVIQRVRVLGGPAWYDGEEYDVIAKAEHEDAAPAQIREMLQNLLADRFHLTVHRETREMTHYVLTVGKKGPMFTEAKADEPVGFAQDDNGVLIFRNNPIVTLINTIANRLDVPVDDQTGLKGRYDYKLEPPQDLPRGAERLDYLLDALGQLGLKLDSKKVPTEVLIVDHCERPSAN